MISRARFTQRLLGVVLILLSLGFVGLGTLFLFEGETSGMSILSATMFIWMGTSFLWLTLSNMKAIRINEDTITIGDFFGLRSKRYDILDIQAINPKPFSNNWKSYPGLLIKFRDNRKVHIHEMEFKNFNEIKNLICDRIDRYEELEIELWTTQFKIFLSFGFLILIGLLIIKLTGM